MKYETPELKALTPAINAIQTSGTGTKHINAVFDNLSGEERDDSSEGYMAWEN
jgi:hypothetical protein